MSRAVTLIVALGSLACGAAVPSPPKDLAAQNDSLRAWATAFEGAINKIGGCGTGADARALLASDGYLYSADSGMVSLSGEAATGMFQAAACGRRSTTFKFDSVVVRSLAPGVGAVVGTYTEIVTDTANARQRVRGSAQWIVQRGATAWTATMVAGTEHSKPIK